MVVYPWKEDNIAKTINNENNLKKCSNCSAKLNFAVHCIFLLHEYWNWKLKLSTTYKYSINRDDQII